MRSSVARSRAKWSRGEAPIFRGVEPPNIGRRGLDSTGATCADGEGIGELMDDGDRRALTRGRDVLARAVWGCKEVIPNCYGMGLQVVGAHATTTSGVRLPVRRRELSAYHALGSRIYPHSFT